MCIKKDYFEKCFGFLPQELDINFDNISIKTLSNYENKLDTLKKIQKDNIIYPPENSILYKMPQSHKLTLYKKANNDITQKTNASLLLNIIGFLFGYRLHFENWWLTKKYYLRSSNNLYIHPSIYAKFINHCYIKWEKWNENYKERIINILSMHSLAPAYDWKWEEFLINYMVFDALYKLTVDMSIIEKAASHEDRLIKLCKKYEMSLDMDNIKKIYILRNDLIHEARWNKGKPCCNGNSKTAIQTDNLRRINNRLIVSIFEYPAKKYIKTSWSRIISTVFE